MNAYQVFYTIILSLSAFIMTAVGTAAAVWGLRQMHGWLDEPNERSNHNVAIPNGAGVPLMVAVIGFLTVGDTDGHILLAAFALAVISFLDDRNPVAPRTRLLVQAIAVMWGLLAIPAGPVLPFGLPVLLDHLLVAIAWLWFLNLYNFMDGIDGITGVQTIAIGLGLIALDVVVGGSVLALDIPLSGGIMAGAAAGFLLFNWYPARIFLGDVGSVPLGFLFGYLLILLCQEGYAAAAFILPAYYVTDATLTLLRRLMQRKRILEAHSEHAYQQAVRQGGRAHDAVSRDVAGMNLVLINLALLSTLGGMWAAAMPGVAYLLAFGFTLRLARSRDYASRFAAA